MLRDNQETAAVVFEKPDGEVGRAGGSSGKFGTRRKFPQVSADLKTRWCSGALKIDVMAAALRNQPRFLNTRTLVVSGERAEESPNRARYHVLESHRTHTQARHVDHYRPVHDWKEADVWDAMRRHGVVPHPAYRLGWGRLSCRTCIFGDPDQWATINAVYPDTFKRIAGHEKDFNATIHRTEDVATHAAKGTVYSASLSQPELAAMADGTEYTGPAIVDPHKWQMPAGAFIHSSGPT